MSRNRSRRAPSRLRAIDHSLGAGHTTRVDQSLHWHAGATATSNKLECAFLPGPVRPLSFCQHGREGVRRIGTLVIGCSQPCIHPSHPSLTFANGQAKHPNDQGMSWSCGVWGECPQHQEEEEEREVSHHTHAFQATKRTASGCGWGAFEHHLEIKDATRSEPLP